MKYIDADRLKAEIERREVILDKYKDSFETAACCKQELEWMKDFITSIQQEQPQVADASKMEEEVDLEKVYDAYCKVCGHYHHTTPAYICRHACDYFKDFEALLKARKED